MILLSQIWDFCLKILKMGKNLQKFDFPNIPRFLNLKNGTDAKEHLSMNMWTKLQVGILKNGWILPFWGPKKSLLRLLGNFGIFRLSNSTRFVSIKNFLGSFLRIRRKCNLKTCFTPPKPKISNLTSFNLLTLDDIDLTQGHKRLRRVLKSIPDTIKAFSSTLFQL